VVVTTKIFIVDLHGQHEIIQTIDIFESEDFIVMGVAGASFGSALFLAIVLVEGTKIVLLQMEYDIPAIIEAKYYAHRQQQVKVKAENTEKPRMDGKLTDRGDSSGRRYPSSWSTLRG
jgi:hypothetical protein